MKGVIRSFRSARWTKIAACLAIAVVSLILITAPLVAAADGRLDSDSRLVTFYDNGIEKTIITKGKTVADAMRDALIKLGDNDKITPGVNQKLDSSGTVVNIRRARPITVIDGSKQTRVVTADTDTATIAKLADSALKANDTTKTSQISNFVGAGGVGQEITITRAKAVTVTLYGQVLNLRTQKPTVRDMLTEAGIKLDPSDTMSIDINAPINDDMAFQIWRNGVQTIEQTEDVPFETQVINDDTKKVGYHEVQTTGQVGKKTVIYQVNMVNGQEVGRQKMSEVITVPAVNQVEVNGTKVELPPGSHTDWMAMAGIPESDYGATNYIISKESGWRYNATNASSGAYGLPQALPGSKMASAGSDWKTNPITQLRWFYSYCKGRYGSIQGAYNYWLAHHSY